MTEIIPPIWENPEIQEINRLPMRSPLLPFLSPREALADCIAGPEFRKWENNDLYESLDGPWQFTLLDNPNADEKGSRGLPDWVSPGFNAAAWPDIQVPGTWTRQGYDKPHYTNKQMPYEVKPPHAPELNPTGCYRRTFTVPHAWKDRRVVLHIGSVESVHLVYMNGVFVGAGKDTRLPSEYDITSLLKEGENLLCIKAIRYSDASHVEDQDQWWYGGIERSVFLYSTEDCFIKDIKAVPGGIENGQGSLKLSLTMGGNVPPGSAQGALAVFSPSDEGPFNINYALYPFTMPADYDDAAKISAEAQPLVSGEMSLDCFYRVNSDKVETDITLEYPKKWSHENPNLYILLVSVSRNGRHIESAAFCTGFRTAKIADRELLINNRAVLIKGVNRHEHDEKTGKTLSTGNMVRDIRLLKSHNFNAVRTSHYPNDERWYDLCDRYGIYLIDETNIECHCFYDQLAGETIWTYAFISRMHRMVERDKNHPSIIAWSLGNESGYGFNHDTGAAWIRRYDPSRPLHYEGAVHSPVRGQSVTADSLQLGRNATDIVCPMYPSIELITEFAKYRDDYRPLIMCEYSHAMGNSNGSLADYWKAIESNHGLQGGFIWDWIDQGLEAFTADGTKYWKYGGDFGDEPTEYDYCNDGLLFPDQTPKPAMAECRYLFAPVRLTPSPESPWSFVLENRYDFSTLENLELRWKLCTEDAVLAEETRGLPPLAPGESAKIQFPKPLNVDPQLYSGTVFIHGDFCLKNDTPWAKAGLVTGSAERIIREYAPVLSSSLTIGEREEFAGLFRPSLFRVPTENDGLKNFMHLRGNPSARSFYQGKAMYPWLDLDLLHLRVTDEKTEKISLTGSPAVRYTAVLMAGENAAEPYRNTRLGLYTCETLIPAEKGPLIMDIIFDLDSSLPELPKVGISAKIPAYYNSISWFGAGPHESYPDRRAGALLGRYSHTVAELEVPYILPQENGNRSGVRSFTISGKQIPKGKPETFTIRADAPLNISASKYTQEDLWRARHLPELTDISIKEGHYILNIDIAQRGVGTATCGPDTREEYRVRPGVYKMRLYIC